MLFEIYTFDIEAPSLSVGWLLLKGAAVVAHAAFFLGAGGDNNDFTIAAHFNNNQSTYNDGALMSKVYISNNI